MTWHLEIDWEVDKAGYELKEFELKEGEETGYSGWYLVPKGGTVEKYRLRDLESRNSGRPAFAEFANIGLAGGGLEPSRLLAFAAHYGLPGGHAAGHVPMHILNIGVNRTKVFLSNVLLKKKSSISLGWGRTPEAYVDFVQTPKGVENQLVIYLKTLPHFLWMQAVLAVEQGGQIKRCAACGDFMAPKSEKRETCSDVCRQRLYRAKEEKLATDRPPEESGIIKHNKNNNIRR